MWCEYPASREIQERAVQEQQLLLEKKRCEKHRGRRGSSMNEPWQTRNKRTEKKRAASTSRTLCNRMQEVTFDGDGERSEPSSDFVKQRIRRQRSLLTMLLGELYFVHGLLIRSGDSGRLLKASLSHPHDRGMSIVLVGAPASFTLFSIVMSTIEDKEAQIRGRIPHDLQPRTNQYQPTDRRHGIHLRCRGRRHIQSDENSFHGEQERENQNVPQPSIVRQDMAWKASKPVLARIGSMSGHPRPETQQRAVKNSHDANERIQQRET